MGQIGSVNGVWQHGSQAAPTTLVDYSAKLRSLDVGFEREMVESTNFGESSQSYTPGLKDGEISAVYEWDATIDDIVRDIYDQGTGVSFSYSPTGTTAADPRMTGTAYISSLGIPEGIGELQTIAVTFKVSGTVTFDTH